MGARPRVRGQTGRAVGWRQLTRSPPSAPLVLQPELSEALLDEILGAADTDGDGNINLQEFRAAVMSR